MSIVCKIALVCQFYTQLFAPKRRKYALVCITKIVFTILACAFLSKKRFGIDIKMKEKIALVTFWSSLFFCVPSMALILLVKV